MPPEWTRTFKPDQGRSRTPCFAALKQSEASCFALKQATSRNLRTMRNLIQQPQSTPKGSAHPERFVISINHPTYSRSQKKRPTPESQRKSRLHSKESGPRQNPPNLFASSFFQQRIASIALGAFRHISPKTLGPYETNQRPGPKP